MFSHMSNTTSSDTGEFPVLTDVVKYCERVVQVENLADVQYNLLNETKRIEHLVTKELKRLGIE